jgi:hypothetical protein
MRLPSPLKGRAGRATPYCRFPRSSEQLHRHENPAGKSPDLTVRQMGDHGTAPTHPMPCKASNRQPGQECAYVDNSARPCHEPSKEFDSNILRRRPRAIPRNGFTICQTTPRSVNRSASSDAMTGPRDSVRTRARSKRGEIYFYGTPDRPHLQAPPDDAQVEAASVPRRPYASPLPTRGTREKRGQAPVPEGIELATDSCIRGGPIRLA